MTDSISRKGVSAWLDNMGYPKLADAIMDEDRFPPVEQKQGEWKKFGEADFRGRRTGRIILICDQCGGQQTINFGKEPLDFCPNCGAHME